MSTPRTIGIFAPSSRIDEDSFDAGIDILHGLGHKTIIHPQTYLKDNQSAGTVAEKVSAYHDLLKDPDVDMIMAATGGNRCLHMLPLIDWDLVKAHPKPLIGFSDVTALLNAIYAKTEQTGIYGPTVQRLPKLTDTMQHATFALTAQTKLPKAPIIGGTLAVFQSLIGTEYMPDPKGKVLFLEDINEETSHIDLMLCHLKYALPFSNLAGIVFGSFTNLQDTGKNPFGFTLDQIIDEHTANLDIPIIRNYPCGHGDDFYALPIGKSLI